MIRMKSNLGYFLLLVLATACTAPQKSSDGADLWFNNNVLAIASTDELPTAICVQESSATFSIIQEQMDEAFVQLGVKPLEAKKGIDNALVIGTFKSPAVLQLLASDNCEQLDKDGFIIRSFPNKNSIVIAGKTDVGALYGTFHFLRLLKTSETDLSCLDIVENPSYQHRLLNHWDNLDGTVERGYAGHSIWQWDELPSTVSPRYKAYARANASIGINGTVLNNVNANPDILTKPYLQKTKVIADVLRPYGIKVYLSINFSSPKELGGLRDSDPLNKEVKVWWKNKVAEIYSIIPDFGGFLVKANSEGLPGPQDYGRSHADGANMLADALAPYGGLVMWRAFVYNPSGNDRAKQAYDEFVPLDGQFRSNVIIQVKNGPVDFQPREPFSPLFGAMKHTALMPELQITKEYLGFSTHLAFLATLFEECLDAKTYRPTSDATVAKITDGSIYNDYPTAIAGVANIGEDTTWCGSDFDQANWYAYGRLAWDNTLSSKSIAQEWVKQTLSANSSVVDSITAMMMASREAVVNYMTPLGLHHLMGWGHHYGPEPWCTVPGARSDWLPIYYHRADSIGLGFDRSSTGTNAVAQYAEPLRSLYDDVNTCPLEYLLWFHHVAWDAQLNTGNTLWDELCFKYSAGVEQVQGFESTWQTLRDNIDVTTYTRIANKLAQQEKEALWWKEACLLYFQTFSKMDFPQEIVRPQGNLDEYKAMKFNLTHHN